MHDLVGGRYRLDEHIGNGGMAEVWRATDSRTGETVAVKRLHPRLAHDPTSRARFAREVEAARAVDHPSAVRVLDAGDGDDGGWLAMDYLAGGSLSDRLRAGPMPSPAVAAIGADIAGALAAVHAAGLVHRDVKPSNILLDEDGGARIGDFGIARGDAIDGLEDVTATGDVVGTLRFLPPEVLAGGPAAASSDVWALGAVMYEALTGRPPFDSSSPAALVASQRSAPAQALPVGDALGVVLDAMLDPSAAARPPAADVAHALGNLARPADPGEDQTVVIPVPARPVAAVVAPVPPVVAPAGAACWGARRCPRRRGIATAGVLVALLLAAGLVVAMNGPFSGRGGSPVTVAPAIGAGATRPLRRPTSPALPRALRRSLWRHRPSRGTRARATGTTSPTSPARATAAEASARTSVMKFRD